MTEVVVEKEQKSKSNGPLPEAGEAHRVGGARAGDARARDARSVTDSDDETGEGDTPTGVEEHVNRWVDEAKATLERLWSWLSRERGLLTEHPAALLDLAIYWWRAPMAGASGLLRFLQRADGFTAGLFFTLTGYAWAWLGQRPLRRYCFLLLALIVWRFR